MPQNWASAASCEGTHPWGSASLDCWFLIFRRFLTMRLSIPLQPLIDHPNFQWEPWEMLTLGRRFFFNSYAGLALSKAAFNVGDLKPGTKGVQPTKTQTPSVGNTTGTAHKTDSAPLQERWSRVKPGQGWAEWGLVTPEPRISDQGPAAKVSLGQGGREAENHQEKLTERCQSHQQPEIFAGFPCAGVEQQPVMRDFTVLGYCSK